MTTDKSCAFTGHRDLTEEVDLKNLKSIIKQLIESGITTFYCGMARGFDLLAASCVLELKKKNKELRLIACVPCPNQQKYFPAEEKKKYESILKKCDEVKILNSHYYNGCMQMRDRFMVDNSGTVLGYKRSNVGGTYYTLMYAVQQNRNIILL